MIGSAMVAAVSEISQYHMDPGTLGRFIRGALWAGFRHKELRVWTCSSSEHSCLLCSSIAVNLHAWWFLSGLSL